MNKKSTQTLDSIIHSDSNTVIKKGVKDYMKSWHTSKIILPAGNTSLA